MTDWISEHARNSICACLAHNPLGDSERETFEHIVRNAYACCVVNGRTPCLRDVMLYVAPNHNLCVDGELRGFRMTVAGDASAAALPLSRNMFSGHTASEINCSDDVDPQTIELMKRGVDDLRAVMTRFLSDVQRDARGHEPLLRCVPSNSVAPISGDAALLHVPEDCGSRDSMPWAPELPHRIGIYHAYVRNMTTGRRMHKLYVICSGGCVRAADELYNILLDVGAHITVSEFCGAEEVWWLRCCSHRTRRRLISRLCSAFGLQAPVVHDAYAFDSDNVASALALSHFNTYDFDVERCSNPHALLNDARHYCSEEARAVAAPASCALCAGRPCSFLSRTVSRNTGATTRSFLKDFFYYNNNATCWGNGRDVLLSAMYPSDGYWLWASSGRGDDAALRDASCVFPTSMFATRAAVGVSNTRDTRRHVLSVYRTQSNGARVESVYINTRKDARVVVYDSAKGGVSSDDGGHGTYQFPNDSFMQSLQKMGWSRDNGVIELVPIIVGIVI